LTIPRNPTTKSRFAIPIPTLGGVHFLNFEHVQAPKKAINLGGEEGEGGREEETEAT